MGYPKKRLELSKIRDINKGRGRGVACKKGMAFLVSDKRKTGDGVWQIPKTKKGRALAGVSSKPGHVGTHVPCLVYGHVYAGVYACPGLFLPSWGDIQKRGRGLIGSVS